MTFDALTVACLAAFAQTVTYTPAGGAPVSIQAAPLTMSLEEGVDPRVHAGWLVSTADVTPVVGDSITVGGVTFKIFDVRTSPADPSAAKVYAAR